MSVVQKMRRHAAVVALLCLASNAYADDWYAGFGLGTAMSKDDFTQLGLSIDDKDTAGKIFAGYQLGKNGAVEFGYADLGTFVGTNATGSYKDTFKANAFTGSFVGILPLSKSFAFTGRLGLAYYQADDSTPFGRAEESGISPTLGVGAQFDFTKDFGMRLEWEKFADIGEDTTTGKTDIDVITLGVLFRF